MQKNSFDDFSKKVQEVTSSMSDDDKLEFYEELLETGSACVSERLVEYTFSIVDGFEYDVHTFSLDELEKESQEMIDDIDFIISMDDDEIFDELDQLDGE